jgi:hypothetical protein
VVAQPPGRVERLVGDGVRLGDQVAFDLLRRLLGGLPEALLQPLERGEEIHCGRPGRGEDVPRGVEALARARRRSAAHRERHAVGGGDADRRRAAHRHLADGDGDFGGLAQCQPDLVGGQESLIEEAEKRAFAVDGE